jgi:imidazolonepropionase-like amidohydrolase
LIDTMTTSAAAQVDVAELARLSTERSVRLRIGRLIDGVSDHPTRNVDVVFDAASIHLIESASGDAEPDATLTDYTLLPCLIEAHAHLFLDGTPVNFQHRENYLKESPDWMLSRARSRWPKILAHGVGAVRDAGDKHGVGLALAAEAKSQIGKLAATPYIDSPGPAIHHRGRYGAFMGQPIEDHDSAADCVAARIAAGADRIKLLVSGIINFKVGQVTTPPQMSIEEVRELVEAARKHGKQTFAHASGTEGVEHSIEGGVNTVEHGFFITEEQLTKMRDRQIAWVPTFAPVQLQIDRAAELGWTDEIVGHLKRIIESHQKMLRRAHELGVTIVAGSDAGSCGVPHALGLLQEMHQMQQAGMPAMSVLRAATGTSAATLAFPEKIGRIAPGCRARFILTRHDPLESVANLQKDKTVLFDGMCVSGTAESSTEGL